MRFSQTDLNMNTLTLSEIKQKLMWFHGEEFEKYPFIEDDDHLDNASKKA